MCIRDRDRFILQPSVLNGLGWNILRVWTLDWFDDKDRVLGNIKAAIDSAPKHEAETAPSSKPAVYSTSQFEKEEASESEFNIIDTAGSLSEALQKSETSDKQVFAVFESDTCTYCHQLRQNTLNDAQVMEKLNESYVVVIINVNDSPEIASKYNVYSTPTMLILDSEGNELKSIEGYYGPEDLIKMI